jgi:N-acetylneuraminic acid mutarotase
MRKLIYITTVLAAISVLFYCTKENPTDSGYKAAKTEADLSISVLFKQAGIAASPDSVDTLRFTVSYGNNNMVYSFAFSAHGGKISDVPTNTAFTIKIEGLDKQGNLIYLGLQSYEGITDDITVKITANEVSPRKPSDLVPTALTATRVKLEWIDNSSNELGFIIERSETNDSNFVPIDTAISDQQAKMDTDGLLPGTIYYYRIASYNGAGLSAFLTPQAVITPTYAQLDSTQPTLTVDALPESVSVESLMVTGEAYDSSGILEVTVEGEKATVGSDSAFSKKIGLKLGQDTITIQAIDNSSRNNDTSATVIIVYDPGASDNTPPTITVSSPSDSDTVLTLTPDISGTVNDAGGSVDSFLMNGTNVTINGIDWNTAVTLSAVGWNEIFFEAADANGNRAYDTLTIFADTTTEDTVAPTIDFGGLTAGYMFSADSPSVTIAVSDNGSVDSVHIQGVQATQGGTDWSATIDLTPDSNTVHVTVWDAAGNSSQDSILVILNRAPSFTTLSSGMANQAYLSVEYLDTVTATDPDGTTGLTYSKLSGPGGMVVGITSGIVTWTPAAETTLVCSVTTIDKYGLKDTIAWSITALDTSTGNTAPTFQIITNTSAMHAVGYIDTIRATDAESQSVTMTLLSGPSGLNLSDSIVTWVPNPALAEQAYTVIIEGNDGNGGLCTLTYNIDLSAYSTTAGEFDMDANTVALWHFSEGMGDSVFDVSGNHLHGQRNGQVWQAGLNGYALYFDGADDSTITTPFGAGYSSLTIEAVIRWDAVIYSNIFEHLGSEAHLEYRDSTSYNGLRLSFHADGNEGTIWTANTPWQPEPGQWYYVVGTYTAPGDLNIYINGGLVKTSSTAYSAKTSTGDAIIGCGNLQGAVDEIRISNTVRSLSDIEDTWVAMGGLLPGQVADPGGMLPLDENTLALWRFDNLGSADTLYDVSSNRNIGLVSGATWTTGKCGKALSFDGINDVVTIPNNGSLDIGAGPVTIEAWIKTIDSVGGIFRRNPAPEGHYFLVLDDGKARYTQEALSREGGEKGVESQETVNDDQWTYIAVIREGYGAGSKAYVNGILSAEGSDYNVDLETEDVSLIGRWGDSFYLGEIDEIRISNIARTPAEIDSLYRLGGWNGVWTPMAAMPTSRENLVSAEYNNTIYVIGGGNSSMLKEIEVYNPLYDDWTAKTDMPHFRYSFTASTVLNKIYAIGGAPDLSLVEEYDPVTDSWDTLKLRMPTPRYYQCAGVVNDIIYVIGGQDGGAIYDKVEAYNPQTDTWDTTLTPMPTARFGLAASVINNKIYAIGGYNTSSKNIVEEYDPLTDTWTPKAQMPTPRHYLTSSVVNGKIYAIGGVDISGELNVVEEYDPVSNSWTTKTGMIYPRKKLTSQAVNGRIYAIGGGKGTQIRYRYNEEYDPALD